MYGDRTLYLPLAGEIPSSSALDELANSFHFDYDSPGGQNCMQALKSRDPSSKSLVARTRTIRFRVKGSRGGGLGGRRLMKKDERTPGPRDRTRRDGENRIVKDEVIGGWGGGTRG